MKCPGDTAICRRGEGSVFFLPLLSKSIILAAEMRQRIATREHSFDGGTGQ